MIVARHHLAPAVWDAYVEAHPQGWVWHLSSWLDYLKAGGREDASVARLDGVGAGAVIGICPALLPVPADDPLPEALGDDWVTDWPTRSQPQPEGRAHGFATRVIDLSLSEADLWRGIRRSYHALIHRAEERYTVRLEPNLDGLALLYRQRHDLPQISDAQWACLTRIQRDGRLRVYGANDALCDLVGAVGIYIWKGWAYYGAGRTLHADGVAHMLQWHTMQALKAEGVPHYEVGWEYRPGIDDEKAKQIAFFKQGLTQTRWWVSVT